MMNKPLFIDTPTEDLLARAGACKASGMRFVQCHAQRADEGRFDLTYTFCDDTANDLVSLRLHIGAEERVPSVGKLFPGAFMFENEMHDLFGINVDDITLDYRGGFYHLHIPAPMAQAPERAAKKAAPTQD